MTLFTTLKKLKSYKLISIEKLNLTLNKQINCFVTILKNLKVIYCKVVFFKQYTN